MADLVNRVLEILLELADHNDPKVRDLANEGRRLYRPTIRHIKRGSYYSILGKLTVQASETIVRDGSTLTLYRGTDGSLYGRPPEEIKQKIRFEVIK